MRQMWLYTALAVGLSLSVAPAARAQEADKGHDEHKTETFKKYTAQDVHHNKLDFDLEKKEHQDKLVSLLLKGEVRELEAVPPTPDPLAIFWELGLWTVVIFILLLAILRKMAWGPMLEGLQKRERSIKESVEEAKKARAETERISAEFKVKMDQAYAEIPKVMEQARREADASKEEMRSQTAKEVQTERQRLRREIETARDQALQELWNQAAQLATLISAKAIGRSLTEDDHRRLLDEAIAELAESGRAGGLPRR